MVRHQFCNQVSAYCIAEVEREIVTLHACQVLFLAVPRPDSPLYVGTSSHHKQLQMVKLSNLSNLSYGKTGCQLTIIVSASEDA